MKFCSYCGGSVVLRVPEGDDRPRHVCEVCGAVHYDNPKVVVGCIPVWQERVLLCRRAIEPRLGYWTLPAGFLEHGETSAQAAAREAMEEANIRIETTGLFAIFDIPRIGQVYLMFRAKLLSPEHHPGPESLEVRMFSEEEIPWGEIAFPSIERTLALYFHDRRTGTYAVHNETIHRRPGEPAK